MRHKPVLLNEVRNLLGLEPGAVVVDGTLGSGGHAAELVKAIGNSGLLIGLDQDPASIERCKEKFSDCSNVSLFHSNFVDLDKILDSLNIPQVDAVLLDIGISSDQLEDATRGFSFDRDGPLDMRMNPHGALQAKDLIADLSQNELESIFRDYGNERYARKIARMIVEERRHMAIQTTNDLVQVIARTIPGAGKYSQGQRPPWLKKNPATKVFQALRIAVNDEINTLKRTLPSVWGRIKCGGKLAVITFHSLEDRAVKWTFRQWHADQEGSLLTKKPIVPTEEEVRANNRARSAKLRGIQKRI